MKILYWCNWKNEYNNDHEGAIKRALEQEGHQVQVVDEKNFTEEEIINADADMLLFFKGASIFGYSISQLETLLKKVPYKKVCWYFDKAWHGREEWLHRVSGVVDLLFITDGDFARGYNYLNVYELKQGADEQSIFKGKKKDYGFDVAFVGSVYGLRQEFVNILFEKYGKRFDIVSNVFGKDLNDLCASALIVAPLYPQTDFYWSQRVYEIIGRGGLLIHPKLELLTKQFKDGKHIIFYKDVNECFEKIDYYLANPKKADKIREAGMKHIKENYTYRHSVRQLMSIVKKDL